MPIKGLGRGKGIVRCPDCKGKGGHKMSGPCFSCDYAEHREGDSCDWRGCLKCGGKGKVRQYQITVTSQINE